MTEKAVIVQKAQLDNLLHANDHLSYYEKLVIM